MRIRIKEKQQCIKKRGGTSWQGKERIKEMDRREEGFDVNEGLRKI